MLKASENLPAKQRRSHGASAFGTFEQVAADVALQATDLEDQRRLRDAEMFGCLAQCLIADRRGEPVQPFPSVRAGQCPGDRGGKVGHLVDDAQG